ncbi:hypothetical protein QW180_05765 [Vibrio sinaloensis]|nr:hypothetical protein [Vibrio sinaloensis]
MKKLCQPILDNFYRAPLDNDIGTSEADKLDPNSWFARWQSIGLDRLERESIAFEHYETKQGLQVVCKSAYRQAGVLLMVSTWHYLISQDGEVSIDVDVELAEGLPPLPRIGMEIALYDHGVSEHQEPVTWFGRGPHENYPDRKILCSFWTLSIFG